MNKKNSLIHRVRPQVFTSEVGSLCSVLTANPPPDARKFFKIINLINNNTVKYLTLVLTSIIRFMYSQVAGDGAGLYTHVIYDGTSSPLLSEDSQVVEGRTVVSNYYSNSPICVVSTGA